MRDVPALNKVVKDISDSQGKLDGLIAAAGIQQETTALEYTAEDANTMFEVRRIEGLIWVAMLIVILGQHYRHLHGCASRSEGDDPMGSWRQHRHDRIHVWHSRQSRKHFQPSHPPKRSLTCTAGPHLPSLQCFESRRNPARSQPCLRMGCARHSRQHYLTRLYRDCNGRGAFRAVS